MVQVRIGGRTYPVKSVPSCKTCQHPMRLEIESALLAGRSYRAILKSLPDDEDWADLNPSYEALRSHFNNQHMPLSAAAERRLIERNYEKSGRKIEEAVDDLVDHVTAAEMVVQKGFERMSRGEIEPEVGDMLKAASFLHQVNQTSQNGIDQEAWFNAMSAYMEEVSRIMSPEQLQALGRRLNQNPTLKAIAAKRQESLTIEGDVA